MHDAEFNTCAISSFKAAIPYLIRGDPEYKVPALSPLELPHIKLTQDQLQVEMTKIKVYGLDQVQKLNDFHWDQRNNIITASVSVQSLEIIGDYKMKGRILVLPIQGEGPFKTSIRK